MNILSKSSKHSVSLLLLSLFIATSSALFIENEAEARSRKHKIQSKHNSLSKASYKSSHHSHKKHRAKTIASSKSKHSKKKAIISAKPKYAYPLEFFMMHAPAFDKSPLEPEISSEIRDAFTRGIADDYSPEKMVKAGIFHHHALSGGIFARREPVKYIVLHSTETGVPVPAKNVINSWNSMGRRHPGAQYVVDRDGTIYQALDPEYAAVHVNIFKTLPGINNDNTIGIEMNHTGRQIYPHAQQHAVMRLVTYLQNRFNIASENIITHKYAQQGDHTDPVNFDLDGFLASKEEFRNRALAFKKVTHPVVQDEQTLNDAPLASVYVQIHGQMTDPKVENKTNKQKDLATQAKELNLQNAL